MVILTQMDVFTDFYRILPSRIRFDSLNENVTQ